MKYRADGQCGFTLLEIMVALAVLAICLGAIIKVAAESTATMSYLRERTIASWVAANKINETLLLQNWPSLGNRQGSVEMAGNEWRWQLKVTMTSDQDLRRLDIAVGTSASVAPISELTAFIGRSQ